MESASYKFVFVELGLLKCDKPCLKPDWMFYQIKENPWTKTKVLSHFKKNVGTKTKRCLEKSESNNTSSNS